MISITLDSDWKEPNDTEPLNMEAPFRQDSTLLDPSDSV